ncbi:MAG TPA: transcriptional regulator, partial [Aliiroseovarius sp.]|nr:transcriptional regulator [Aliiroseovarius sp.]
SLYGEAGYRAIERDAIQRILETHEQVILAVGGGVVENAGSFALLLKHFRTIWIKARPEEHMERVRAQGDLRPMAGISDAMARLRGILSAREALYARAETCVDTSGKPVSDSLDDLIKALSTDKAHIPE